MKYIISESQYNKLLNEQDTDVCLQDELDELNDLLSGVVEVEAEDLGGEIPDEEILAQVQDPKNKSLMSRVLSNLSQMSPDQLRDELKKIISLRNIKEQSTPYFERVTNIGGVEVPTAAVHGVLGLLAISILSKIINSLGNNRGGSGGGRRRRYGRIASKATGCQGGSARARLVRMRRRRENWKSFLRKLGLR